MDNIKSEQILKCSNMFETLRNYDPARDAADIIIDEDFSVGKCSGILNDTDTAQTVISVHTVVDGNVGGDEDVLLKGRINGDVKLASDITSKGVLVGNISAENINLEDAKVFGNSEASGDITVTDGTVVVGNIKADNVIVDGKVKGSIEAKGTASFLKDAVVVADIKTGKINVDKESKLNANITLVTDNLTAVPDDEFDMDLGDK